MATPTPHVFSSAEHAHLTPYLAALHGLCITHDQMLGTFLPPLNHERLLGWWKGKIAEVSVGTRVILMLLNEANPGSRARGEELVGVIMLDLPTADTSPHCAVVESLLISPKYRRRGGARAMITAVEAEAVRRGKTLLRMEVEAGSDAEAVFKKFGYQEVGKIPGYAVAQSGQKKDEAIFYKDLS